MARFIHNVLRVSPDRPVEPVSIELSNEGRIGSVVSPDQLPAGAVVAFDGDGCIRAFPGFIDIHTHGANGADLSDATADAVRTIAEAKLREGVTTLLPTTWTETPEALQAMAAAAASYRDAGEPFARTPFLHVEGPYLNPDQAGAQDPVKMRPPDTAEIDRIREICPVGLISLAIELDGALPFIDAMRERGVVTSAAHSAATIEQFRGARDHGLGHLTHFCNQMSPLHHRAVGLVGAGFLDDGVMIELIADTIHLSRDMLQIVFRHRSCDRLMLITDSMAASHLGEGDYPLGDTTITVKDGAARIPAGNLAGSILRFNEAVGNVAEITELPLNTLVRTASTNQARTLGLSDRGRLEPGLLADVALLDARFRVKSVFVGGSQRWAV